MNRTVLTLVVTAVVALGAGIGLGAAMWAGGDHDDGAADAHGDAMSMSIAAMDEQDFLARMVPHHESAVVMAELARTKAQRPAVRRLAENIIEAQEQEIADMQRWHREWYGRDLTPDTDGTHDQVDMAALETTSGAEFERAFLRMMIPHHASAIMMAEAVMMGSPRGDVATLAGEVTAAQAKEIGQMQRWREAWFPPLG
jgi:uncharacterized protein (DUF305 family)